MEMSVEMKYNRDEEPALYVDYVNGTETKKTDCVRCKPLRDPQYIRCLAE